MKTCTKCGREFPATMEYFFRDKSKDCGLRPECKECHKRRQAEHRATHLDEVIAYHAAYKAFYNAAHREELRASSAAYYEAHKAERAARYAAGNTPERRQRLNEEQKTRHAEHPEMRSARRRNRRARLKGALGKHTADDVAQQYLRQNGRCYWCCYRVGKDYHVDHVFPLARGGSNGPENIVIACPTCNFKKKAKLPHEFSDRLC